MTARSACIRCAAAGAGVVLGALALRAYGLTERSLWFDETVSVFLAGRPAAAMLALLPANDPHPPLYYLLLRAWMALFGNGEAAVRSLSVLVSVPVALATWAFGRRLIGGAPGGAAAALFAAAVAAVAPSQIAAGQEARMYGLLTLAALLSWWALQVAVTGDRRRAWAGWALATAVMLYTHYYGFFVVASQIGYLLWQRTDEGRWRHWVYASLGVVLLFLPWMPSFIEQIAGGRAWPAHRVPLSAATLPDTLAAMTVGRPILETWGPRTTTIQAGGGALLAAVGMIAALALAVAAARSKAVPRGVVRLLLAASLGPPLVAFATSMALNVYAPRYLLFIVPPIALLVAAGAAALFAGPARWVRAAAVIAAALVLIPNAAGALAFHRQPRLDVFDWRLVSRTLAAQARGDDAIAFLPGFSRIPVNYYFRGSQARLALTPVGVDVVGDGGARTAHVVEALARHPRVWILTVPPVPQAVEVLIEMLGGRAYAVTRQEGINMARLILLERTRAP